MRRVMAEKSIIMVILVKSDPIRCCQVCETAVRKSACRLGLELRGCP